MNGVNEPDLSGAGPSPQRATEQLWRARGYGLLAAALRAAPDQTLLDELARLAWIEPDDTELTAAMAMLGLTAARSRTAAVEDEFHELFIGLGRGELVPYGSWYQTGFLLERPLGQLRDDLARLGYRRAEQVCEPEDHVAALCEVMMLLIEDGAPRAAQRRFFAAHLGGWIERFWRDLDAVQAAAFYRAVARLGLAFIDFEQRYLTMQD